MSVLDLKKMSVTDLVGRFVALALKQDQALREGSNRKYNRIYDQMSAVKEELKGRSGDQRRALLSLFGHDNLEVRLSAAMATMAIAPVEARHMLETIAEMDRQPQSGNAGMSLSALDRGVWDPK